MKTCKYGDPTCPCQDGDPCHYEGDNPMNVPPEFVGPLIDSLIEERQEDWKATALSNAEQLEAMKVDRDSLRYGLEALAKEKKEWLEEKKKLESENSELNELIDLGRERHFGNNEKTIANLEQQLLESRRNTKLLNKWARLQPKTLICKFCNEIIVSIPDLGISHKCQKK